MNPRILKVIAIAWAVGLLGTYVACRSRSHSGSSANAPPASEGTGPIEVSPNSANFTNAGGLQTFVGGKSAGAFFPADVESTQPADTQPIHIQPTQTQPTTSQPALLPGSKSFKVDTQPVRVLPGWKSAPPDWGTPTPATTPPDDQAPQTRPR